MHAKEKVDEDEKQQQTTAKFLKKITNDSGIFN